MCFLATKNWELETQRKGTLRFLANCQPVHRQVGKPGKDKWSITRGALIPPCTPTWGGPQPNPFAPFTAPLAVTVDIEPGMSAWLSTENDSHAGYLAVFDAAANRLAWDSQTKRIPLPVGAATNFHVASYVPRKSETGHTIPDAFDLRLTVADAGGAAVLTDTVRLKVAPLILPPECSPATAVYSTHAIPAVTNLTQANAGLNASRWTQDMVKLAKVQCAGGPCATVALGLDYDASSQLTTFLSSLQMMRAGWTFSEQECGNGGNMMATPPLPDAPYGKIMLGTAHNESKAYWEAQGIQPVIDIPNNWLLVGHVDELFMWITPNKVIYADPWKAAELIYGEFSKDLGTNTLWCGWDAAGTNSTVAGVAIDNGKITTLPVTIPWSSTNVTVTFGSAIFAPDDYLHVGFEVLRVESVNGAACVLERAQGSSPAGTHLSGSFIYALSPLMKKNLLHLNGNPSVATRISIAMNALKLGLGGYASGVSFIPVPVLFNDNVPIVGVSPDLFAACTANLANCLMVTPNEIYYSDPGIEAFKNYFKDHVAAGAVAVDVWEDYHCWCGEIHCGTAAVRSLPHTPPWWEQDAIKTKWKDEK